jgi:hypothetical protein
MLRLIDQALQFVVRDRHFINSSIFVIRDAWKQNLAALQPNRHEHYSLFTFVRTCRRLSPDIRQSTFVIRHD